MVCLSCLKKLRKVDGVTNADCEHVCFMYAVLSMLHYDDVKKDRQRVAKYMRWEHELVFDGTDVDAMDIRHVAKFERLNNIKVNVHVWENGLKGMRYNSRKNTAPRNQLPLPF